MRIWLVTVGEPLPMDRENVRLHRVGTLSSYCAARGHDVTWWTSTFDHIAKKHRAAADTRLALNNNLQVEMLYAPGYKSNISVSRLLNHYLLGKALARRIRSEPPPDVILASWPTIELCAACVEYGKVMGVPVIVDVRDLWPDIFVTFAGRFFRPVARLGLVPFIRWTKYVFQNCTGIIGISPGYLKWALQYSGRPRGALDLVFPLGYNEVQTSETHLAKARKHLVDLGIDARKTICWFIGMFGSTYDLTTVIKAAEIVEREGENGVQFVFSGSGERETEWRKQAEGLTNVVFTGWVDAATIRCIGEIASVGLAAYVPLAPQGVPNKVFEYMAMGLPILNCLSGESEEFLEEHQCGISYKAGDPRSLVDSLNRFISNETLRVEFGRSARRTYESLYSADKIFSAMVEYLEQIAHLNAKKQPEFVSV